MEVRILDNAGKPLSREELGRLQVWNSTLEHICATAIQRLKQAEVSSPVLNPEAQTS